MLLALMGLAATLAGPVQDHGLKNTSGAKYLGGGMRFEYTVTWEAVEGTRPGIMFAQSCDNPCRGKKHVLHTDCDTSCDGACPNVHKKVVTPYLTIGGNPPIWQTAEMKGVGLAEPSLPFTFIVEALDKQVKKVTPQEQIEVNFKHWNTAPCSSQRREMLFEVLRAKCHVKFVREGKNPDGSVTTTTVKELDWTEAEVMIPTKEFKDSEAIVRCACSVVTQIKEDGTYIPPTPTTGGGSTGGSTGGETTGGTSGGSTGGVTGGAGGALFDPMSSGEDMMGRRASLFDLGIYAGGAYSTNWFDIGGDPLPPISTDINLNHDYGYDGGLFVGYDLGAFRIESEVAYKKADLEGFLPTGPPIGDSAFNQFNFNVQLDDMVGGTLTGTNPFPIPYWIFIPAGTTFDTDADGVQDCVLVVDVWMEMPPATITLGDLAGERFQASANDPASGPLLLPESSNPAIKQPSNPTPAQVSKKVRVMCLEMAKDEPDPKTKYKIKRSEDQTMSRIARQISKARMRGPWDQAKVWAYTDQATYEQIRKKLIPAPRKGAYGRALFELGQAGVNFRDPKFAKLVEPTLLTQFGSDRTTFWLTHRVADNPKALEAWVKTGAAEMAELLGPESRPEDVKHFARVVDILAWRKEPECRRSALAIVNAVPPSAREKLQKANLLPVWMLCWSEDKAIADQAMQLMAIYKPPQKEFIELNMPAK